MITTARETTNTGEMDTNIKIELSSNFYKDVTNKKKYTKHSS